MTWNREMDRVLAEKCEGWTLLTSGPHRGFWRRQDDVLAVAIPDYSTDLVAVVRAAEAWRKGKPKRHWKHGVWANGKEWARVAEWKSATPKQYGPAALAHALY